jgi:hypothetical protein
MSLEKNSSRLHSLAVDGAGLASAAQLSPAGAAAAHAGAQQPHISTSACPGNPSEVRPVAPHSIAYEALFCVLGGYLGIK